MRTPTAPDPDVLAYVRAYADRQAAARPVEVPVWRAPVRCARASCLAPVEVRILTAALSCHSMCAEHGRDLWRSLGGATCDGVWFTWWTL